MTHRMRQPVAEPEPPTKAPAKRFDLRSHLTRLFGTDLTLIPGIGESTALVLFAELGPDLSRFRPRRNSRPG